MPADRGRTLYRFALSVRAEVERPEDASLTRVGRHLLAVAICLESLRPAGGVCRAFMARRRLSAGDDQVRVECARIAFMFRVLAAEAKCASTSTRRGDFLARAGELIDRLLDDASERDVRVSA